MSPLFVCGKIGIIYQHTHVLVYEHYKVKKYY